jgi:hypothetical protein
MKSAYFAATAICLAAASAAGAQTAPKPAAAPVAAAAPAATAPAVKPVAAPVIAPIFAPTPAPAPVAAPVPRPAPVTAPVVVSNADPVETWVRKMIAHHREAISMAQSMMNNTQDRQAANLAKGTFYREQRDVTSLQAWLKRHGKTAQ